METGLERVEFGLGLIKGTGETLASFNAYAEIF